MFQMYVIFTGTHVGMERLVGGECWKPVRASKPQHVSDVIFFYSILGEGVPPMNPDINHAYQVVFTYQV